jgi:hypothetical protein
VNLVNLYPCFSINFYFSKIRSRKGVLWKKVSKVHTKIAISATGLLLWGFTRFIKVHTLKRERGCSGQDFTKNPEHFHVLVLGVLTTVGEVESHFRVHRVADRGASFQGILLRIQCVACEPRV